MPKWIFTAFVFILLCTASCSRSVNPVRSIYAFRTEKLPGTLQPDENGNPPVMRRDTVMLLFVETGMGSIEWMAASFGNRDYTIAASPVEGEVIAGFNPETQLTVKLKAAEGYRLWRLELIPASPPVSLSGKSNGLVLYGRMGNKKFQHTVYSFTDLKVPDVY